MMPRRTENARSRPKRQGARCARLMVELRREKRKRPPSIPHLKGQVAVQHTRPVDKLFHMPPPLTPEERAAVERWATRHRQKPGWVMSVDPGQPGEDEMAMFDRATQALQDTVDTVTYALAQYRPVMADKRADPCYTQAVPWWRQLQHLVESGLIKRWRRGE